MLYRLPVIAGEAFIVVRVIIADADEENRQNFRTFIKTTKKEFTVVKTLGAGKDVMAEIEESDVQLLIADMRFFGPSGISVIKKLHTYFPQLLIILYGTYNDAEYMEKTAETGVVTYMFKPVKPAELSKTMDKALRILKKNDEDKRVKEQLLSSYKRSLPIFVDRFLINLMHGQIANESEFLESVEYFGFGITPPYRVFIVKIDSFKQISLALDHNEKQLLIFQVQNIVSRQLESIKNGIAFINHISSVTAVLGGDFDSGELYTFLDNLKDTINRELKISVSIGVGREYTRGLDIQVSYKQAKSALRYGHLVGGYSVIPIDFVEPKNILTYKYPHKKEELLTFSAVVGDSEKTISYLNGIFAALREAGSLPEKLIPNIIVDIAISINRYVSEQKNIDQSVIQSIFNIKDALRITTIDEGYDYLRKSLLQLCRNIEEARGVREKEVIGAVKEYVEEHYYENISLVETGKMFSCVPEYLNSIFIKHENKTYYDYVMGKRLEVAKKLLAREDVDEDVIAISIGYKDGAYFKSVFLQYEGISTDEFRDLLARGALKEEA